MAELAQATKTNLADLKADPTRWTFAIALAQVVLVVAPVPLVA